jgi:hypothetical protein
MKYTKKRGHKKAYGKKLSKEQKKEVKMIIGKNVEQKVVRGVATLASVGSSGVIIDDVLSSIIQGNSDNTRIGDEIRLKHLKLRYDIHTGSANVFAHPDDNNDVRIIALRWYGDSSVDVPTVAKILEVTSAGAVCMSPYNAQNRHKYHIIYDRVHNVSISFVATGNSAVITGYAGPNSTYITPTELAFYGKQLGPKTVSYPNGGSVGAMNDVIFLAVSDSSFTPNPLIGIGYDIAYTDA